MFTACESKPLLPWTNDAPPQALVPVAVPVAREHGMLGKTFVDQNDYPREAPLEALLRFIAEDLGSGGNSALP